MRKKTQVVKKYQALKLMAPECCFDSIEAASMSPGFSEAWFEGRGITRNELKVLERMGLAVRGYTKNYWESGDEHPTTGEPIPMGKSRFAGQEFEFKKQYRGKGSKVVWVLMQELKASEMNTSFETISEKTDGVPSESPVAGQPKASPQT